ncbi:DUF167 domain-containing protein [Candidatus Saccharibacteria bacterium]|nr:DUF167 domain-containing protein [Candidatus Saccharibacteria bacterium]
MLYQIKVKPGSSQEKVIQNDDDTLIVYLRAKPHDGEANTALIKILAKHFDVPKTTITIKSGAKGRLKTVEF